MKSHSEPSPLPAFTREDIIDLVGPVLFERGLDYWHKGMVERVGWDGTTLTGIVQGVSEPYYRVAVRPTESGWDTECTCPYDDAVCKHIAAVMLAVLEDKSLLQGKAIPEDVKKSGRLTEAELRSFVFGMPKKQIAETLWSVALDDLELYRRLELKALAAKGGNVNLAEFRRQIRSALYWRGFVEYRDVPTYAARLEAVAGGLRDLAEKGHPDEAAELLESLIDGCTARVEALDDSDGILSGLISALFKEWAELLVRAPDLDRKGLAHRVLKRLESDEYGLAEDIITDMAQALGKDGLDELEALVRPKYEEERRAANAKARHGLFDSDRLHPYREVLKDIADARGDVDGYLALCEMDFLRASDCLQIAQRLRGARRFAEALDIVERGLDLREHRDTLSMLELGKLRVRLLNEAGRTDDAARAAWEYFVEYPSASAFDALLAYAPKGEGASLREKALAHLLGEGSLSVAIDICLREKETVRLAPALSARREELLGLDYTVLAPLARELEEDSPDLSILLYRKLALDILEEKRSRAYYHAVDYLRHVKKLLVGSGRAVEWQELREEIKVGHKRKHSFMGMFQGL